MRGLLAGAFVLAATHVSFAKCGTEPNDAAQVLAVRELAATSCQCASFTNHGQYVKCVKGVAEQQAGLHNLSPECKGSVTRCAAHSICGKTGFVTCCVSSSHGTICKTKKDEAHCTAKGGTVTGTATTGCSSCCDACPAPGSGPSCVGGGSPSAAFLR